MKLVPVIVAVSLEARPLSIVTVGVIVPPTVTLKLTTEIASIAIAALLLPSLAALRQPYGELLVAKTALFAVLLGCAALNKWRLGPALGRGDLQAGKGFRRVVITEYVIMVVVLSVTAVMTTFFSPE